MEAALARKYDGKLVHPLLVYWTGSTPVLPNSCFMVSTSTRAAPKSCEKKTAGCAKYVRGPKSVDSQVTALRVEGVKSHH